MRLLLILSVFFIGCSERDTTYNYDYSVHSTYDMRHACDTARQTMRRVNLDDQASVQFDGTNCIINFNLTEE